MILDLCLGWIIFQKFNSRGWNKNVLDGKKLISGGTSIRHQRVCFFDFVIHLLSIMNAWGWKNVFNRTSIVLNHLRLDAFSDATIDW